MALLVRLISSLDSTSLHGQIIDLSISDEIFSSRLNEYFINIAMADRYVEYVKWIEAQKTDLNILSYQSEICYEIWGVKKWLPLSKKQKNGRISSINTGWLWLTLIFNLSRKWIARMREWLNKKNKNPKRERKTNRHIDTYLDGNIVPNAQKPIHTQYIYDERTRTLVCRHLIAQYTHSMPCKTLSFIMFGAFQGKPKPNHKTCREKNGRRRVFDWFFNAIFHNFREFFPNIRPQNIESLIGTRKIWWHLPAVLDVCWHFLMISTHFV